MTEVNLKDHFNLFHAMMRSETDRSDAEVERAKSILIWATERLTSISKFLEPEERRLLSVIWEYWLKHKAAPTRAMLGEQVHKQDKSDGMSALLQQYDSFAKDLHAHDSIDINAVFDACVDECERVTLVNYLHNAVTITSGGLQSEKRGDPNLIGVKDARMYLIQKLQSGVFAGSRGTVGGTMTDTAGDLVSIYDNNKKQAADKTLVIPTGISVLDETISGIRRRSFNIILGAAGQRKSAMARTIAYNAAINGFRVLFLPLEMHRDEELTIFGIMHGNNGNYFEGTEDLSVERFEQGKLTKEEEDFIETDIVPDMKKRLGDNLSIMQLPEPTWDAVRSTIELQNFILPLDLVVIDHFALLDVGKEKDQTAAINTYAKKGKDFVLYDIDNGRGGLSIVSPAHGSRKGVEDAKANDGNWVREGIYMYSGLEKAADLIMFTYMDPEMQKTGFMKVGTCKSRRSIDVAAQLVAVDHKTHVVGGKREGVSGNATLPENSNIKEPELQIGGNG